MHARNVAKRPWFRTAGIVYSPTMHQALRAIPCGNLRHAIRIGLLSCLTLSALSALSACEQADPLEAIRQQQLIGDYLGSIEPLREYLEANPDDSEANYLYGTALTSTNQGNLAVWSFRKAMNDPEWLVRAGLSLAYGALVSNDFNEVVEVSGRVLEVEPDNESALMMRGNAYAHWRKDPELALADAERLLELNPDALDAYEPKILALLSLDRLDEASEALAEAGRRLQESGDQDNPTKQAVLAWHCSTTAAFERESEKLEQARETWIRCLDAHPSNSEVVTNAATFYDEMGEPERALEVLRSALAASPTSRAFRLALALRLSGSGNTAEADAVLREPTQSENPLVAATAWLDLGELRRAQGEFAAAADAIERGIGLARETGSPEAPLLFGYADVLVLAGRLDEAFDVAARLSNPAQRQLIRARVAQERRQPAQALREFDGALKLWPDNPWGRYYAALAAEEFGDFERALAEYRYAVRIDAGSTDARTRGADLLLALGQPRSALQMLQTAADEAPLPIEGQLMQLRLWAILGQTAAVTDALTRFGTDLAVPVVADAAEDVSWLAGPAKALKMLASLPALDFEDPRFSAVLRARVRISHLVEGKAAEQAASLTRILAAYPDSSAFQEIRGLNLELSGAPGDAVRAAYTRALEIEPGNAQALAGLGRLALADDAEAALVLFDRAASADPSDPNLQLLSARALVAAGKPELAAERLDRLLVEHPFDAEAASERARLDLERGAATDRTLERARRAVNLRHGPDTLELLSRVHLQRGEPEPAAQAAERAQKLREAASAAAVSQG